MSYLWESLFGNQARREATGNTPDLGEVALIIFHDFPDHVHWAEILALPGIMTNHGAHKGIGIGRIDSRPNEHPFRRKLDLSHTHNPFSFPIALTCALGVRGTS